MLDGDEIDARLEKEELTGDVAALVVDWITELIVTMLLLAVVEGESEEKCEDVSD